MKKILFAAMALALVGAPAAQAQQWNVGLLGGYGILGSSAEGSESEGKITYGLEANYNVSDMIEAGVWFTMWNSTETVAGITADQTVNTLALQGNYKLNNVLEGLFVGAKVGLAMFSAEVTGFPDSSSSDLLVGPALGYDYMVTPNISVGAEANYLYIMSDPNSSNLINTVASVAYHF